VYRITVRGSDPVNAIQDLAGNPLAGGQDVTSTFTVDTTPPTVRLAFSPNVLWPPNHKLVTVRAQITASDALSADTTVTLLSVTSNEPDVSPGTGNFPNDTQGAAVGTDDRDFDLRAERDGAGAGRAYKVTYLVRDGAGNGRVVAGYVVVPHDQGQGQAL